MPNRAAWEASGTPRGLAAAAGQRDTLPWGRFAVREHILVVKPWLVAQTRFESVSNNQSVYVAAGGVVGGVIGPQCQSVCIYSTVSSAIL